MERGKKVIQSQLSKGTKIFKAKQAGSLALYLVSCLLETAIFEADSSLK